ncbi:hemagglutinin repeat-containing protein [Fusobacterium massiliense]|uniref:hemagglutinin repeat-containing protein n=1 Tax=Fusobacterium massiliense TaxID=1852365 RepID=UPI0009F50740|nr:hemagglutinin repeat-containing protein [Fusobacterium massiliense]
MKGSLKRLIATFMLLLHIVSLADGIIPDTDRSKNLNVDKAINGVPLVNIEAPNNNGISHNVYKEYNVDGRGAILNNSVDIVNSQLGGLIYGNPNFQNERREANTILNEVSGVNRSRIEGYQEIVGKKANYILANPNGIFVNSAGFINTGNVTLTTGSENNLQSPEKGTIEVAGKGLDLRNINKAELIARVAELSAPIYGGEEVNLKLGSQGQPNKPEYALDARELGSIYAGRINIVVNEDGVGVKTEAPMYAEKGDVVISSKGKVYLKDTQAKGDIKISSTETEIRDKLVAENTINIESKKTKNSGQIQANKDITINGDVDSSNLISTNKDISISGDLKNSGKIEANKDVNVKGNVENTKIILANKDLNIKGDLTNTANIQAKNNIDINSKSIDNKGIIVAEKEISIKSNNINNSNKIATKELLNINNKILINSGKIYSEKETKIVNQKIDNTGDVVSSGKIDINSTDIESNNILANGDISINTKELKSKGKIYSDKDIKLIANNIENNELTAKRLEIVADKLDNNTKILTTDKQNIMTKTLVNKGMIHSSEEIDLKAVDLLNNGNILSIGNMSISQNKKIINDGKIQSNEDIVINSKDIKNNKELIGKNVNIETDKLESTDKLIATNNMIVNSGVLNNNSLIQASKMILEGDAITNNGDILAVNDVTIKNKNLKNDGSLINNKRIQSNNTLKINIKDIKNNGIVFSKNKLNIESKNLSNKNEIVTNGKAIINSDILENDKTKGVIFSKDELDISSSKVNLTTNIGAGKLLKIQTNELERDNSYITNSDLDIKVNGNYKNEYELIGKNLKLEANNLENNSIMASSGNTEIKGNNSFKNNENSLLYARELLKLEGKDFSNKGEVSSFGNLNMNFTSDITNLNTIEAAGDGEITANNFTNKGYLTGSHSYKKVNGAQSNVDVSKLPSEIKQRIEEQLQEEWNKSSRHHKRWEGESYLDGAKVGVSNYKSNKAYLKTEGNLTFNITNKLLNQEADILAGKNIIINAGELNNTREGKEVDIELYFKRNYSYKKRVRRRHSRKNANFSTGIAYKQTLYSDKPTQIIAGGDLTVNAKEVGNGEYQDHKSGYINDVKKVEKDSNIKNTNIDDTFKITNNSVVEKIKKDSAVGVEDYIEIPKNDNGMFIVNKKVDNPKFSYLIETNPKMIDKGFYLSSEYFFSRIKFNPDRDIRLLGDSFYENRLITRAVLEGTGKRYLYSNDVNEERKKLFDNAIAAQKDLNLSLGIALSKEQINNLKSDILWYVEEVVNGEKVLIPKLYLSENTLKSIVEEQGNIIKAGGNFVVNNASIVDNSGKIIAKNNVLIKSKNIYQNAAYSDTGIYGNNVALIAKENIENIGGNILAENDINIFSENGDIKNSKKLSIHDNDYHDVYTDVRGSGNIVGNNISIIANNVENTGADVKAQDKIEIGARKNLVIGNLEAIDKKVRDGGKDYVLDEKKTNVGSNLKAKDISLTSLGDIGINGSNIVATNEASIQAKGDISIVAGKDSILHKESHSKSKGFGRSSSEESVAYATRNVASNIIGDKVNITSEKDVSLLGSNVQANTEGQIKADGNITQAGVKDINYSYYKKTKTGFMGLTSKSVTDENYAEKAILSATLAGDKGLTYDSKNNLLLEGVKVVSSGNINLKGKNVEINPLETKAYSKHKEEKKGFSGSLSAKGVSLSYGKDKLSSDTDIVNQTASQIVSNKDINIEATNKVKAKSVDIYAKNDINISGDKGVEISTANNSYDNTTKQSSSRIGANVGINPAIVNTVENIKDIKNLTDFSGNSYDILNNASKVVGAIKDGAKATNDLINFEYSVDDTTGAETLKYKPRIFSASISYNKSESKSSMHNESVEKSLLVSGNNMNIKSKNGSITISGTDVKVGNDLDLSAKKDITIKASEENYTSSSSSSQTGISLSANLEEGRIADLSISQAGTRARGNGTNYINSTVNVGGKLKANSENLTLSGANVEADKLDIKAKNVVIESKQDKSERKDSSYGGSFSIDIVNPSNFSVSVNGSKGSGEKEWVNKQSSLIAKNGGKIDTEDLTNIGAVIGSENEKEKLKISANKVVVKDLEDKNKYENIGGGISFGTDVPNISVKHDKIDKEQINKASAINTDFEISGKKTSAEDLGFNTDIDKAQEKTKDEEKHLDAELHTDLIGEDKRNEIKYAFKKLGSLHEILDQKKFKESIEGVLLDKFKDEHQKEFNLIKEESLSLEDKQKLAQNLIERYLRENGYEGEIPEVLLTNEAHSFSVDSKDKETGAKRREKIYFSKNDIADPNLAFSRLFGHEKAHMNTYDEGKYGEDTSIHTTKKIGSENKNKVFTEEEKADYLNNLRNKYKDQKSIEQQFAEAKLVPEKDKEHFFNEEVYDKYVNPNLNAKEIEELSKKFNVSKKKIEKNQTQYVYYDFLDKNNRVFKDKKEFEKFQKELKEKIKNEKDPKKREELEKQVYRNVSDITAQYHNIEIDENGEVSINLKFPNEKHVNNIGQEAVFNKKSGKWVNDGINNATYNIAGLDGTIKGFAYDNLIYHLFADESDVNLWIKYDVEQNSKLTEIQRRQLNEIGSRYYLDLIFRDYVNTRGKLNYRIYEDYMQMIKGDL